MTKYFVDRPIENESDNLINAFSHYRDALIEVIEGCSETPLTIGIHGDWGSGKTSLMRLIEEKLKSREENFRSIWFNPWLYTNQMALWRAFLLKVLNDFYPKENSSLEQKNWDQMNEKEKELTKQLDDMCASLYGDVSREEVGHIKIDPDKLAKSAIKSLSQLTLSLISPLDVIPKVIQAAQGNVPKGINEILDAFQREKITYSRRHVASLEQFRSNFTDLIRNQVSNKILVIFIDDLDRCLPEEAVKVLESLKLFLDVKRVVFIIAVDPKVVIRGVQVKYQNFLKIGDGDLPIDGKDYLEKIIQMPFWLRPLDEKSFDRFFVEDVFDKNIKLNKLSNVFKFGLKKNPRKMKRMINNFNILWRLADENLKSKKNSFVFIAKIIIIRDWFPQLDGWFIRVPSTLGNIEKKIKENKTNEKLRPEINIEELDLKIYMEPEPLNVFTKEPFFSELNEDDIKDYLRLTTVTSTEEDLLEPKQSSVEISKINQPPKADISENIFIFRKLDLSIIDKIKENKELFKIEDDPMSLIGKLVREGSLQLPNINNPFYVVNKEIRKSVLDNIKSTDLKKYQELNMAAYKLYKKLLELVEGLNNIELIPFEIEALYHFLEALRMVKKDSDLDDVLKEDESLCQKLKEKLEKDDDIKQRLKEKLEKDDDIKQRLKEIEKDNAIKPFLEKIDFYGEITNLINI